jgi:hypothetical protein
MPNVFSRREGTMAAHLLLGTYIETLLWGFLSAGTRTAAARGLQENPTHIGPTRMPVHGPTPSRFRTELVRTVTGT